MTNVRTHDESNTLVHQAPAMNFGLTTEQQMVVDTVRGFVERELYPHEEEVERTGQVPPELRESIKRKVIDLGFYAPNLRWKSVAEGSTT